MMNVNDSNVHEQPENTVAEQHAPVAGDGQAEVARSMAEMVKERKWV